MFLFVSQMTVSYTILFPVYCLLKIVNGCCSQTAFIHWLAQWSVNVTDWNDSDCIISKPINCKYNTCNTLISGNILGENAGVDVRRCNKGLNLKSDALKRWTTEQYS